METNPLIGNFGHPKFDEITVAHIEPAAQQVLAQCRKLLEKIEKQTDEPTWDNLLVPLETISLELHNTISPVTHLMGVKNSPELRQAYDKIQPSIVSFGLELAQNRKIYQRLVAIKEGSEWQTLNESQRRVIENRLRSSKHMGIELEGAKLTRFNEISQSLSKLATQFSNNVLDATKEFYLVITDKNDLAEVPSSYLEYWAQTYNSRKKSDAREASGKDGPWGITLDFPSFGPFLKFCPNRSLREEVYRAHVTRAYQGDHSNTQNIDEILRLRKEMANLLGYDSYAELSVADKMADSVEAVEELLENLRAVGYPAAQKELQQTQDYAAKHGFQGKLEPWDTSFYSEKLKQELFHFSEESLRPYFPLDKVLNGLFDLVHRLFKIEVKLTTDNIPTWHETVSYYDIFDDKGKKIAGFYLDPYSRPENKRGGAWMDVCISRSIHDGKLLIPVAYLVCNSTPPVDGQSDLLSFREVETLFHEFGHGLQHMLTQIDHLDASGINGVEWDAVELPSQFMENWCYHKPTLDRITAHVETGESLPQELFDKLIAVKNFGAGLMITRQIQFSLIDLELHHRYTGKESVFEIDQKVAKHCSPAPKIEDDRFLCSFSHIFAGGYAAGYYSYKWAEVLSADAFSRFEEEGLRDDTIGRVGGEFRDTVLALGGGQHPMEVFKQFRGREPKVDALLKHCGLS